MKLLAAILLLVGGLAHLIPAFYNWLSSITGGTPWIQIIVGLLSVLVGLGILFKKEQ